jgi:peptide/nickel transport system substrate-binding protein
MIKQVSRRSFIRWTALAAAGAVVAACAPQAAPTAAPATKAPVEPAPTKAAPAEPTATMESVAVPPTATPAPTVAVAKYNEAPALADLVKAGKLPPVDERLPKNPTVLETETIGEYGGILYQASLGVNQYFDMAHINEVYMFVPNNAGTAMQPDAAESFKISDDATEVTLKLREGMKWSDGEPFTTDDMIYRWTEEFGVKGLEHWSDGLWKVAGKDVVFTKVDDFTLSIKMPSAFRPVVGMLGNWTALQTCFYDPAHYLKQFNIKYNPDAEKAAKDAGFEFWYQAYAKHRTSILDRSEGGCPTLAPVVISETDTTHVKWDRNPYYFSTDTAGNQLPYVDSLYMYVVENMELVKAKAMSGDLSTFGAWFTQLVDMPAYKENESKGDYTTREWVMPTPAALMVAFNLTHTDPVLRKIFGDVKFRQAMSMAVNRQEIIDKLFYGKAEPTQATVERHCSFAKPEWEKAFAEYSTDKANTLLDEIGLKWDATKKFRMRPDGKPLKVVISHQPEYSPSTLELVKGYWDAVGVQTDVKEIQRDLYNTKGTANQLDVCVWNADRMIELRVFQPGATKWEPNSEMHYAEPWASWRNTGGDETKLASGAAKPEEPPQEWKDQFALMDKWYTCTSDEEYKTLGQQVWQFFSDQLVNIGLYGYPTQPQVVKNGLMNLPEKANLDDGLNWFKSLHPETFWWKKA